MCDVIWLSETLRWLFHVEHFLYAVHFHPIYGFDTLDYPRVIHWSIIKSFFRIILIPCTTKTQTLPTFFSEIVLRMRLEGSRGEVLLLTFTGEDSSRKMWKLINFSSTVWGRKNVWRSHSVVRSFIRSKAWDFSLCNSDVSSRYIKQPQRKSSFDMLLRRFCRKKVHEGSQ